MLSCPYFVSTKIVDASSWNNGDRNLGSSDSKKWSRWWLHSGIDWFEGKSEMKGDVPMLHPFFRHFLRHPRTFKDDFRWFSLGKQAKRESEDKERVAYRLPDALVHWQVPMIDWWNLRCARSRRGESLASGLSNGLLFAGSGTISNCVFPCSSSNFLAHYLTWASLNTLVY